MMVVLNLSSSNIPRCLCTEVELTGILLKYTLGWDDYQKVFEISRNNPRTLGPISKALKIS